MLAFRGYRYAQPTAKLGLSPVGEGRGHLSDVRFQFSEIQIDRRSKVTKLFGICPVVGLHHGAAASSRRKWRVAVGAAGRQPAPRGCVARRASSVFSRGLSGAKPPERLLPLLMFPAGNHQSCSVMIPPETSAYARFPWVSLRSTHG